MIQPKLYIILKPVTMSLLPGVKMDSKFLNLIWLLFFILYINQIKHRFYECQIEDITSDGQCTVVFTHQKKRLAEVCLVSLLKPIGKKSRFYQSNSHKFSSSSSSFSYNTRNNSNNDSNINNNGGAIGAVGDRASNTMNHFKRTQEAREAQKKKQQKWKDKVKVLEEERERDKKKWQSFSNRVCF